MKQHESRKIRDNLTVEERERLEKHGALSFKSVRRPDMRVEKFIPSRTQY
jgi:hypothetical protein